MRTPQEWLDEFNLYANNIASNKAPGYEPFEVSSILTRAEEAVVIGLYTGTISADSFESTEELTSYLDSLVKQQTISAEVTGTGVKKATGKSHVFQLPPDLLFRTLETCVISGDCGTVEAEVIPVTQDKLLRTMRNPFRKQNGRRVLRLSYSTIQGTGFNETRYSELISDYPITSYTVRYLERPLPIIVANLPAGYTINGEYSQAMACLLPEQVHPLIIERAVQIAKAVWNN